MRDARLASARNLGDLLEIVCAAFPQPEAPARYARRIDIDISRLPSRGSVRDLWEDVIVLADNGRESDSFERLLNVLADEARSTRYGEALREWSSRSGVVDLGGSAKECAQLMRQIMESVDPLVSEDYVLALSRVLKEMSGLLARPDLMRDTFPNLSAAVQVTDAARAYTRRAIAAADHMLGGIQSASALISRLPLNGRPESNFEAIHTMKGRLLDQRAVVDECVSDVLNALLKAWPQLLR